jgi:hypothetical protein
MAITSNPTVQNGAVLTAQGQKTFFNITGSAAVVKSTAGRVAKISVVTAGSTAGNLYDAATTGAAGTGNWLAVIPEAVGVYNIDMPVSNGIVVSPGTGMVLAISYI